MRPALNNWQAHSVAVDITNANGEWVVYTGWFTARVTLWPCWSRLLTWRGSAGGLEL